MFLTQAVDIANTKPRLKAAQLVSTSRHAENKLGSLGTGLADTWS